VNDPARPALRFGPDELDQVMRLARFRVAHPAVVIRTGQFGTWEACIPEPDGQTIIVRHRLAHVLDKLDELTGGTTG
jgi:hypothetical protein